MSTINWNDGRLITLEQGDTATSTALQRGQLYGIFLYNSTMADQNITINVVWSNSQPPVLVTVPGTTANEGLASIVLVSGNDTQTISISNTNSANTTLQAWIGSVSAPNNTTGLSNQQLPNDGRAHQFSKFNRYFAVAPSSWQQMTIQSNITQFISVQFSQDFAYINIVNPTSNSYQRVTPVGNVRKDTDYKINQPSSGIPQVLTYPFQGDGTQKVWMNADSPQNSENATITWQNLTF
jgi:hypothetical protein